MYAHWPQPLGEVFRTHYGLDATDEALANARYEVVNQGRGLRRDFAIASNKKVRFVFRPASPVAEHDAEVLKILLNAETLEIADAAWVAPKGTPTALTPLGDLHLPLEGLIDVAAERERLQKEIAKVEQELTTVQRKLSSENFVKGAPAAVVDEHRQRQNAWQEKLAQLSKMREALG
jgi:valyl-tRNA synthetase